MNFKPEAIKPPKVRRIPVTFSMGLDVLEEVDRRVGKGDRSQQIEGWILRGMKEDDRAALEKEVGG